MNLQVIKNRILYWLKSITLYGLFVFLILVITSFFVIQIPAVQGALSNRFLKRFSEVTGFKVHVERMDINWFDRVYMEGLTILDPEKNTMIGIEKLRLNYRFADLFQDKNISLDAVLLDGVQVKFKTINETDTSRNLNINVFVKGINKLSGKGGGGGKVSIGEAILHNTLFTYDTDRDTIAGRFDPNHFVIDAPDIELQNFLILGDTIEFNVLSLTATEQTQDFTIHELSTFYRISQQSMEFLGIKAKAGESIITDTVRFEYDTQQDLSDFINRVDVYATLVNSVIYPKDLAVFAPLPKNLTQPITLSGHFKGRVNRFRLNEMDLRSGNTHLLGSLEMDGLPDINETFILLNLKRSQVNFTDLSFLFNEGIVKRLKPLGQLNLQGQFLGFPTDFVANGTLSSEIGTIISDINFKVDDERVEESSYAGKLTMINFNLGKYLEDTINFQSVSMNGQISGKGLTQNNADFTLNGTIKSLGIRGYDYTNINTNARFAAEFFSGKIEINDPNLEFHATGSIDLRNKINEVKLTGRLDTAHVHKLNLSKKVLFLQSNLDLDFRGFSLDSLIGRADLNDLFIQYEDQQLAVNDIVFEAKKDEASRKLEIQSSLVDAQVSGNFYFSKLAKDIPTLVKEFRLNIRNDSAAIAQYYNQKRYAPDRYAADFQVNIKALDPIMTLLNIDLDISKNTFIEGRFLSGPVSSIQAFTEIDSIRYGKNFFFKTEFDLHASKDSDSTEALAMAYLHSQTQEIGNLKTRNLNSEIIWDRNLIDADLSISQQGNTNRIDLSGIIDFRDSTHIRLQPSSIRVLDKKWDVIPDNSIKIAGKEWNFKNFGFTQLNQTIKLNGQLSEDSTKQLFFSISNFDLTNINPLIIRKLEGELNSVVVLNNFYGQQNIQNTLSIDHLLVDDFLFGNITGNNVWDPITRRFNLEFFIDRLENRIVNCKGFYNPSDKESPLLITASFNKANLRIFEPFIDDIFSQFQGTLTGAYKVSGTLNEPKLSGEGQVENGAMMINYLRTVYQFKGILGLTPKSIYFKDIELTDAFRNKGKLSGAITHNNFRNIQISLDGEFDDFQVLNTTAKDNSLFYGQAYASGIVNFRGPIDNLIITATATTRKNTRMYIPISGTTSVEQKDYINFVNFNDSTYQISQTEEEIRRVKLTGVTIDFNLDVTPDAYCEIIFDLKAGDIIRGRGNGKIKLQLDTKGEFNMFGPIEFTEGWYNFTLYDIINKEFQIRPGSSIAWYGDPYQGTMRIDASYNQLASLAPILNDPSLANVPQVKRKYPVQVLLKLDGPMLSPSINFDITSRDLPKSIPVENRGSVALDLEFTRFKNSLDEQELKRQVFSLIVLRRFSPPESFNTSGSLVNSVSELFSNQLSYWLSQVDENLEIDVDLGSMDQETFNTFQLRMSYTFMNGRLRITRDGTLGNQSQPNAGADTRNDIASAIGDWTVDYLLSPDGKFKVKMYSRTNVNPLLNTFNNQSIITTGVSLMHTQSFNEFKDLLKSSRDKNRRLPDDEEELNDEALKEEDDGE